MIATFPKPAADAATTEAVKADLAATEHDVPIPQNARVLSYVELFQGRLRDYIQESLTRGTKYLPMIQAVFRAEGLPLDLAYIPIIESGFKTNALSKASAKGPWQFMRATAVEQGLKHNWYVDERSDPEKATVAAAKYLKTPRSSSPGTRPSTASTSPPKSRSPTTRSPFPGPSTCAGSRSGPAARSTTSSP
jgi:membrane-bound lytic murein transglycosylase D